MSGVFNVAKGMLGYYQNLPDASSALIVVPLLSAGLETEPTILRHDNLAAVLAGTSNENTTVIDPYVRLVLSGLSTEVDDVNDRRDFDSGNITFPATPGATGAVGALLVCYRPGAAPADNLIIPLTKHDVSWTPDGNAMTWTVDDWARAN